MNLITLAIDIGNTSSKWGVFQKGNLVRKENTSRDTQSYSAFLQTLLPQPMNCPIRAVMASVVPETSKHIALALASSGIPLGIIDRFSQIPMPISLKEPNQVGMDRLLAAYAGLKMAPGASHVITIDAGTAITVDLVSREKGFLGGAILPGFHLMAKSLHDHTALLPLAARPFPVQKGPGANSLEAIQVGISSAGIGGVARLIADYQLLAGENTKIFFTGGDGLLLAEALMQKNAYHPDMVLWALNFLDSH
ncbi:MAG: type III pantothenate kinase [Gemmataceae bacterium]|nr:type III pantothenate kinase [Gemmataceae bacterium]